MTATKTKPSNIFWIVTIIALIWNLMGVMAYLNDAYMSPEDIAALPAPEQQYHNNVAAWATAAYAFAVFGGTLGCILLLLKKKLATVFFVISLIAVIAQAIYNIFIQDFVAIGSNQKLFTLVLILIGACLVWFSTYSTKKGWIS